MRKANLVKILELLDEENIAREVGFLFDVAREIYEIKYWVVSDVDQFYDEITSFYQHMHCIAVSHGGEVVPVWMARGFALNILDSAFSQIGGYGGAYSLASSGIRGGIRSSLDAICEHLRKEGEETYIDYVVTSYVDVTDFDDRTELMRQYLSRFGRNLPPGARARTAAELAVNPKDIIKIHLKVIQSIRGRLTQ